MIRHKWILKVRNQLASLAMECDSAAAIEGARMTAAERQALQKKSDGWSEEDINMLQSILDEYKSMPTEKRNWLESLKNKQTWKPSKEQMSALKQCIDYRVNLRTLYNDLKKLMEE